MSIQKFNQKFEHKFNVFLNIAVSIECYLSDILSVADAVSEMLDEETHLPTIHYERAYVRNDIDTIALFDTNANIVAKIDDRVMKSAEHLYEQDWFKSIKGGDTVFTNPHAQMLYRGYHPWVISLCKPFSWIDRMGAEKDGLLLIDMNFNNIKLSVQASLDKPDIFTSLVWTVRSFITLVSRLYMPISFEKIYRLLTISQTASQ